MFTVKWVYRTKDGSVTHLFKADRVSYAYRDASRPAADYMQLHGRDVPVSGLVVMDGYDMGGSSFDCGTIYVMNEAGKTVDSYRLGDKDETIVSDPVSSPPPEAPPVRHAA